MIKMTGLGVGLAAAASLVAACSSSGGSTAGSGAAGSGGTGSSTTASAPAGAAAGAVTLTVESGSLGRYLADGTGRTLYEFASDTAGSSTCSGACATAWPPLLTTSAGTAGAGVSASGIATITRPDGSRQISYDGHPLYYFVKDAKPGDVTGQGLDAFGAKWWLVAPSGQAITSSAPSSSSGGGSGY